jgi:alpha-N-acetylglucosamine transferase
MELEYFTRLETVPHKELDVIMVHILKDIPTPLQWQFTIESFREEFEVVKKKKKRFAFVMDVRKIGRLTIAQIKEFVNLLESFDFILQDYLVASSIYTTKNSILATLFEIMKTFYKTKKPLKFVYEMEEAYEFIDSFGDKIIKDSD